jgi:hypothetical protein
MVSGIKRKQPAQRGALLHSCPHQVMQARVAGAAASPSRSAGAVKRLVLKCRNHGKVSNRQQAATPPHAAGNDTSAGLAITLRTCLTAECDPAQAEMKVRQMRKYRSHRGIPPSEFTEKKQKPWGAKKAKARDFPRLAAEESLSWHHHFGPSPAIFCPYG